MRKFFVLFFVFSVGVAAGVLGVAMRQHQAITTVVMAPVATSTAPEPSLTAEEWCDVHLLHPRSAMPSCVERRRSGVLKLSTER